MDAARDLVSNLVARGVPAELAGHIDADSLAAHMYRRTCPTGPPDPHCESLVRLLLWQSAY